MKTGRKFFPRLLALALISALMFALPLSVRAEEAPAAAVQAQPEAPSGFWSAVGLPSLRYWPSEGYLFHTKYAYQWLFGFNSTYDTLSPVAGCFYDTLRFKFNYGGRDWMVQVWKGTYGYGLYTGGEMGLYSKAQWNPVEHYQGAGTSDWIGMEFSIYHYQNKIFTRPMENTWWVTGFKQYITGRDFSREFLTMEGALRFPNAEMAAACAQAMAAKGFTLGNTALDRSYTDRYSINGNTVRFLWREKAD